MPTVKSIIADIKFVQDHPEEYGTRIAPMLRNVAGLNVDADVNDFVAAAVEMGFHPATAKTCFYKGRKLMTDLDAEVSAPVRVSTPKPLSDNPKYRCNVCGAVNHLEGDHEADLLGRIDVTCPSCDTQLTLNPINRGE